MGLMVLASVLGEAQPEPEAEAETASSEICRLPGSIVRRQPGHVQRVNSVWPSGVLTAGNLDRLINRQRG